MDITKEQARAVMEANNGYNIDNMEEHKRVALIAWGDENTSDGAYARGLGVILEPAKVREWLQAEVNRGTPLIEAATAAAVLVGEIVDYIGRTTNNPTYVWTYMGRIISDVLNNSLQQLNDTKPTIN